MSIELACRTTHPQIAAGPCPWCREPVGGSDAVLAAWDLDRVRADLLGSDPGARRATRWNLTYMLPGVEPSLSLLNEALAGEDADLRSETTAALALAGPKLPPEWLARVEEALSRRPDDLAARILLLARDWGSHLQSDEARRRHEAHALWIIEHAPASEIAGPPYAHAQLNWHLNRDAFEMGKRLWLRHVEARPDDVRVLGNAASYLAIEDTTKCGEFLRRCRSLEPGNPRWSMQLGHLYSLSMMGEDADAQRDWAAMAQAEYEREQGLHANEKERLGRLPSLAEMAFESGDHAKAGAYATELLDRAAEGHPGEAIFWGNQILGRLALAAGDVQGAKARLLASATTTGSPVLRSFGPSMKLAAELLGRGEKEAVLRYLAACRHFWESGQEEIATWSGLIERGESPDRRFGWR